MKTKEIEIWEAEINGSQVNVSYTIFDGELAIEDKKDTIMRDSLRSFIIEKGLNEYCEDVLTGDYNSMDSADYLSENLNAVVKQYLEEKSC